MASLGNMENQWADNADENQTESGSKVPPQDSVRWMQMSQGMPHPGLLPWELLPSPQMPPQGLPHPRILGGENVQFLRHSGPEMSHPRMPHWGLLPYPGVPPQGMHHHHQGMPPQGMHHHHQGMPPQGLPHPGILGGENVQCLRHSGPETSRPVMPPWELLPYSRMPPQGMPHWSVPTNKPASAPGQSLWMQGAPQGLGFQSSPSPSAELPGMTLPSTPQLSHQPQNQIKAAAKEAATVAAGQETDTNLGKAAGVKKVAQGNDRKGGERGGGRKNSTSQKGKEATLKGGVNSRPASNSALGVSNGAREVAQRTPREDQVLKNEALSTSTGAVFAVLSPVRLPARHRPQDQIKVAASKAAMASKAATTAASQNTDTNAGKVTGAKRVAEANRRTGGKGGNRGKGGRNSTNQRGRKKNKATEKGGANGRSAGNLAFSVSNGVRGVALLKEQALKNRAPSTSTGAIPALMVSSGGMRPSAPSAIQSILARRGEPVAKVAEKATEKVAAVIINTAVNVKDVASVSVDAKCGVRGAEHAEDSEKQAGGSAWSDRTCEEYVCASGLW